MKIPNKQLTTSELLDPAMKIKTQRKADEYFNALVDYHINMFGSAREESEKNVRLNLGYYAGYYDGETMQRVNKLFKTSHPVFGNIIPTPEEAYSMGEKLGKEILSENS